MPSQTLCASCTIPSCCNSASTPHLRPLRPPIEPAPSELDPASPKSAFCDKLHCKTSRLSPNNYQQMSAASLEPVHPFTAELDAPLDAFCSFSRSLSPTRLGTPAHPFAFSREIHGTDTHYEASEEARPLITLVASSWPNLAGQHIRDSGFEGQDCPLR